MRRKLAPVVALTLVGVLVVAAGCTSDSKHRKRSSSSDRPAAAAGAEKPAKVDTDDTDDTDDTATLPSVTPGTTRSPRRAAPLTCAELRNSQVGSSRVRYQGLPGAITLTGGRWSGEDGATVELQSPCGIGDLDGDGDSDAVGAVLLDGGGTGRFWTVVAWGNENGSPRFRTLVDLGDRTPVQSIRIAGRQATVVYLTRSEDRAFAELDVRRTAVYRLSGTRLTLVSHSDAPYRP